MSKKTIQLANFNIVFLEDEKIEEPMLKYFDIVMNALSSDFRKGKETQIFFTDIRVIKQETEYVLIGKIVKKTTLEVKSILDDQNRLQEADNKYPAAPYSAFAIFLRNHRMAFAKNQKGSPTLREMESLTNACLRAYINKDNKLRTNPVKMKNEAILIPAVSIKGIPGASNLTEILNRVNKIKKVSFRFFPLNGDVDFSAPFGTLISEIRKYSGSKTGNLSLNSPQNKEAVSQLVGSSQGTAEATIFVKYKDGTDGKITNDNILEEKSITVSGDYVNEDEVAKVSGDITSLHQSTEEHNNIYKMYQSNIVPFVKKIR